MRAHFQKQQELSRCPAKGQLRSQDHRKPASVRHHGGLEGEMTSTVAAPQVSGVVVELVIKTDMI